MRTVSMYCAQRSGCTWHTACLKPRVTVFFFFYIFISFFSRAAIRNFVIRTLLGGAQHSSANPDAQGAQGVLGVVVVFSPSSIVARDETHAHTHHTHSNETVCPATTPSSRAFVQRLALSALVSGRRGQPGRGGGGRLWHSGVDVVVRASRIGALARAFI